MGEKKIRILYLFPGPIYRPDLPDFRDRFEMLSDLYEGEIYSWTWDARYSEYKINEFGFRGFIGKRGRFFKAKQAFYIFKNIFKRSNKNKFDVIICYDPFFTGALGVALKWILRSKLIIEVNNFNFADSIILHYGKGVISAIKIVIYKIIQQFVYFHADRIKILTIEQKKSPSVSRWKDKVSVFHDFVPTHYFKDDASNAKKEILCVGWPFYLKGMDILVKAFDRIKAKHPDFKLCLMGHLVSEQYYDFFDEIDDRVRLMKPVYYNELRNVMNSCYCFVLPSRTEGMGRVLIEAMSCAKPVIGSKTGGIPELIRDGENGYLFDPENTGELADKLDILLSEEGRARIMGQEGLKVVNDRYSSKKYCEYFNEMVKGVVSGGLV